MIVEKKNCYLTVDVTVVTVRPIDHSIAIWTAFALKPEVLNDQNIQGTGLRYSIQLFSVGKVAQGSHRKGITKKSSMKLLFLASNGTAYKYSAVRWV
jgi:hypothetical protein